MSKASPVSLWTRKLRHLALAATFGIAGQAVHAAAPAPTTTTLAVTSGGNPVANVVPGTVVALTATVAVGTVPANIGQVNFCDASANACTDIHLLSTVALTTSGTATFLFVPGAGTHSYKAVFVGDIYGPSSASSASILTVGPAPKPFYTETATVTDSGTQGYDTLTATVIGYGGAAAPVGTVSFLDSSFGNTSLGSAPLGAATPGLGFHVAPTPAINTSTLSQVTADFNGDGVPDLALLSATDSGAAAITILFGKGDGTFTAGPTTQSTVMGNINYFLLAADLNGDGKTDIAFLTSSFDLENGILSTFLGKGDGTFAAPVTLPISQALNGGDGIPGSLIAADFNGDGKIDLAAAGDYIAQGGVIILLGNGDGTFNGPGPILQSGLGFNQVATGDFNGDGIPDLVATQYFYPGGAYVFLGKGDGTFTSLAATLATQPFVSSIVVGDFNQDGKPDQAFGYSNGGVAVYLGNGDGTFAQSTGALLTGAGLSLSFGDFNHDGKLDLAGVDNYNDVIDLYLGVGDGTFTEVTTTPEVSQDFIGPFSIVAADFNEDGVPDLAMLTRNQATASILLTEPTQTAQATVTGITPVGAGTHNIVASYPGDANYSSTVSPPITLNATLAPVKISLNAGTYASAQTITLSESVPGATIFYALSGTLSTQGDIPYTGPIQLADGGEETLYTYATETGYQSSSSTSATYYLDLSTLPAPVFSPAAGSYPGAQTVTITDSVAGATIYYTTDGSLPTVASAKYTGALTVSSSETVAAIALVNGYDVSAAAGAQYLIGSSRASFIYTIAGNGFNGYSGDGGQATNAQLNQPYSSVLDSAGNLYFTDSSNNVVRKVAATTGVITTVVGNGIGGYSGDNGPAANAELSFPIGLASDAAGNLYIGDYRNNVIRKVVIATGVITTIAGNGSLGFSGDGGPATAAQLQYPWGLAVDAAGNLYIADGCECIRKVAAKTGVITTVAGNEQPGYSGDGGPAAAAQLDFPTALATDSAGNLYIADAENFVIREINAKTGVITTVAGNGFRGLSQYGGYTGDGGPATSAELSTPMGLALDSAGNLYISDAINLVIRKVTASSGIISTVAGNGTSCNSLGGDGGPPTSAGFCFLEGVAVDATGNLYIADVGYSRMREVKVSSLPPAAQTAAPVFSVGEGVYSTPQTVTVSDSTPGAAIYVTLDGSTPSTASQGYLGPLSISGGVTVQAIAVAPGYTASEPVSATYTIAEQPATIITTAFGDGAAGFYNGGGSPRSAEFGSLTGIAVDGFGNIFFADADNNVVWEVTAQSGQISVVAGVGPPGTGNSQTQANVPLSAPAGLAVDSAGNLFIADTNNGVVRKVAAGTGLITVYAGDGRNGSTQDVGDGGPATSAQLSFPSGLAVDSAGNLYIADSNDSRVRLVTASTGVITTVAGNGNVGPTADGGLATSTTVAAPGAIALDSSGNLYIAEPQFGLIRKVTISTGLISTVAGYCNAGSSGNGGSALKAEINPKGLAVDAVGNLYLSDPSTIRVVSAATGIIATYAGNGYFGYSGDGESATIAEMRLPQGIAFDASGNLYISDGSNYRVREVLSATHAFVAPTITVIPSATSITTAQTLSVNVVVQGGSGNATPTGSLTLASGSYSAQQNLANGSAAFSLAAGSLPVGANALTAIYAPDSASAGTYAVASQMETVTVTSPTGAAIASLTLTPSATAITNQQALTVTASVTGGNGQVTPTGTVTLTSGSYSSQQPISTGAASFTVPAGALTAATNTLTATYSGDSNYAATSGTTSITVVPLVVTVPTPPPVAAGSAATATVTFSAGSTYSGTLQVSCALTVSPSGAQSVPTCSVNPASITIAAGGTVTTTVTVSTTKSSSGSALNRWGGGGIVALALLFVMPRLRRRKTALLLVVFGIAMTGCGGGTSGSGAPPGNTPATTPGTYTFAVTAADASNATNVRTSAHLTITVQ